MRKDLHHNVEQKVALNVATISSDTTTAGNIIDLAGFEAIEFVLFGGTRSAGTITPLIEDGQDAGLSDAAAVDDNWLLGVADTGQEAAAALTASNTAQRIGYIPQKRYVRLSAVSTGSASWTGVGAVALLYHALDVPTA